MEYKFISNKQEDTIELAKKIEKENFSNMVICLNGQLGTGKTVFTKGFAEALNIKENITSPTFIIVKEYFSGKLPLYHIDAYRLEDKEDNIGLVDYFYKDGITIIEWPEMIKDELPEERLDIQIEAIDETTRYIKIVPYGSKYFDLCETIF